MIMSITKKIFSLNFSYYQQKYFMNHLNFIKHFKAIWIFDDFHFFIVVVVAIDWWKALFDFDFPIYLA